MIAGIRPLPAYPRPARVEAALDLVFPPLCVGCRRVGRWICERCWPEVTWDMSWHCPQCQREAPPTGCAQCPPRFPLSVACVTTFEATAREAVHALKYNERHAIAGMMGRLMAAVASAVEVDAVVHVPLHRARRRERGYDQSALLARHLAKALGTPHVSGLVRVRPTRQQALLDREGRRANVEGAFAARGDWGGKRILLVDDVTTTGATLLAAGQALADAGAETAVGVVFGQAP